jgi:hypothetical protein
MTDASKREWEPDVVIYHGHCDDGFAAAWACWRRWPDAQYVPMQYGDPLPDIAGKRVLMVDFSLKAGAMREAAKVAASIVVLDHHKTAEAELAEWTLHSCGSGKGGAAHVADIAGMIDDCRDLSGEPIVAVFDMDKSGCRLAWEFCHPDEDLPRLLQHIEDRDLWRFKIEHTREVSAALRVCDKEFDLWDRLAANVMFLVNDGDAILRAQQKHVADFLENAYLAEVAGFTVPVLNVPYAYASECGHALLKKYPEVPFAATWFRGREGKILWSLRSEDTREDVGVIAAMLGGGGHRNASGFSTTEGMPVRPPSRLKIGDVRELEAILAAAVQERWEWTTFTRPDGSPIRSHEDIAETMAASAHKTPDSLELHGISLPSVDRDAPNVVCYTGNGPHSAAHARAIASLWMAAPELLQIARTYLNWGSSFTCAARRQGTAGGNDPVDCDWPVCGCDDHAMKVIESLEESGHLVQRDKAQEQAP